MKKILCIIIVIIICIPCMAQSDSIKKVQKKNTPQAKNIPELYLAKVHDILEYEYFTENHWTLGIQFQKLDYIRSNTDVIEDFRKWLLDVKGSGPFSTGMSIGLYEISLFKKHAKSIEKLVENINFVNKEPAKYLYNNNTVPMRFANKDNKVVFLLTKYGSQMVFNTLRVSAKDRAAKIIGSLILPAMKEFKRAFNGSGICYYGMTVFFGSKDFSKESDILNLEPEMVTMVVSSEQYQKYSEGTITDDDLLTSADIYSTDRETSDVKKIKIKFD
ncbi:MAG: hypothetical protein PHV90_09570 [Smithella sp.]|nr:hypothetical protein [Smithella sp.]